MEEELISKRHFFFLLGIIVFFLLFTLFKSFFFGKAKLVICDVGQGDGMYLRTSSGVDVIIDAGPDRSILECLGKYMPLFDKTIELAFLTNPQKDHYGGFIPILDGYKIKRFIGSPILNPSKKFSQLESLLLQKNSSIEVLYKGSIIIEGNSQFTFLWPQKEFVEARILPNPKSISPLSRYISSIDPNTISQVIFFKDGDFEVLFTGDAEQTVFSYIVSDKKAKKLISQDNKVNGRICINFLCKISRLQIEVLKVPHHGSKNGLTSAMYMLADPMMSVIGVGRKNSYGHPSKETIDMFKASNRPYYSTGQNGTLVIEYNKAVMKVKKSY